MATYKIAVTWHMSGTYTLDAPSLEKAMEIVNAADPPCQELPKGRYIDDSMEIDMDQTNELNGVQDPDEE